MESVGNRLDQCSLILRQVEISLVEGLENAGYTMDAEVKALYEKYSTEEKAYWAKRGD